MNKVLIIGAAGFVGDYLIEEIKKVGRWSLSVTKMPGELISHQGIDVYDLNILEQEAIIKVLEETQPDYIFHLAAQSSVALSWKNPALTIDINIKGTVNLLESVRMVKANPRILLIGSGEEYGHIVEYENPINENALPRPGNIYAATKACQNMIGRIYTDAYHMYVMSVRAFNHIGPNQTSMFVVADFCSQVAAIENGKQEPVIRVGNLTAKRDFTDVRDVVRAYILLMELGIAGETYNVGSGNAISIDEILKEILNLSTESITVKIEPTKFRPIDVPIIEADISKLYSCTGWKPEIPLTQTLIETLNYWRKR